ncbi:outer membrane lipoprotein-sorting protein [Pseudohalioglobus sediminis]|uniref:Outer membrane lipoprotein-sorting protein n=1 Tax=Pseudohalioglobus sediminis TaxID=2606449 RepID=A0A5B0WSP0_9GAMM|nr:outer membrane lipoprotein-sorting protein [Pseudohalioglobus sediminis]KAA1189241.1 outer membrane lipoprotein-sorting protein [Pseudohalioglobus sediminis]
MRWIAVILGLVITTATWAEELTARDIIRKAMDHYRGQTSYSEMSMTIHRPDWERTMTMQGWSKGDKHTLVRVMAPKKDAGNGTLSVDGNMWTYTPKINRVIKVPSSMMSQNWMGSDFSNKDISKDTAIIDDYTHTLLSTGEHEGHALWTIESIPHEEAAVVWGREVLVIRDDWVLLEQQFWDQDGELVKTLKASEIREMGGRNVATVLRMAKVDTPDEWTEVHTEQVEFDLALPDNLFTLSSLRNPRQ